MKRSYGLSSGIVLACLALTAGAEQAESPTSIPLQMDPGPMMYQPRPVFHGMRLERGVNTQGYYLKIHVTCVDPKTVHVVPVGQSLVISSEGSFRAEQMAPYGYSSFQSSGSLRNRVSVPRGADLTRMQRSHGDGIILISIPRHNGPESAR